MVELLEWSAFLMGLVTVFLYGRDVKAGAMAGIICAGLFIIFGVIADVQAAIYTNIAFMAIHYYNLFTKGNV